MRGDESGAVVPVIALEIRRCFSFEKTQGNREVTDQWTGREKTVESENGKSAKTWRVTGDRQACRLSLQRTAYDSRLFATSKGERSTPLSPTADPGPVRSVRFTIAITVKERGN